MLVKLEVQSFKALTDARIPLRPLTALIGPNGAGKSTVLQAIDLMGALVRSSLPDHLEANEWEYADLPHLRAAHWKIHLVAHLRFGASMVEWRVTLGARRFPGIAAESVIERTEGRKARRLLDREGRRMRRLDEQSGVNEQIQQTLTSSWLAALDPEEDAERFPTLVQVARWARGIRGYFFLDPLKLRARNRGDTQQDDRSVGAGGPLRAFGLHRQVARELPVSRPGVPGGKRARSAFESPETRAGASARSTSDVDGSRGARRERRPCDPPPKLSAVVCALRG